MKIGKALGAALLVSAMALGSLPATAPAQAAVQAQTAPASHLVSDSNQQTIIDVFEGHNAFRAAKGLTPLKFNTGISAISQGWSDYMGEAGVFYHNPDFTTGSPGGFLGAGENIAARHDRSGNALVQMWINSPGHNANMSNPAWGFIGIGVAYTDKTQGRHATYSAVNFFQYKPGAIPPGTYNHPRDYFSGKPQLTPTIPAMKTVIPKAPTWDTVKRTYTIPDSEEVEYRVGSTYSMPVAKKPGPHAADDGYHWIEAFGKEGYYVLPYSSDKAPTVWDMTFPKLKVVAHVPVFDKTAQTVTIPAVTGVQYTLNGWREDAGVHRFFETAVVKAEPTRGYELTGTTEWSVNFPLTKVTVKPPVFNHAAGAYTIPKVTGVRYLVNGKVQPAGTYSSRSQVTISAEAEPGYSAVGDSYWNESLALIEIWLFGPDFWDDSYTIRTEDGVQYYVNGKAVSPGTYPANGAKITVTAEPKPGYILYRNASGPWSHQFVTEVTALNPKFDKAAGTYTIPAKTGLQYFVNDKAVKPGTYAAAGTTITVTVAEASDAYYIISGERWWQETFPTPKPPIVKVTPPAPSFSGATGKYTIPARTGVSYLANGKTVQAGTYDGGKTKVTVTAKAASGYVLSGTFTWSHDFTPPKPPVQAPVKVTAAAPAFDAKTGRYTIPAVTGVVYEANGKTVKAGTYDGGKAKVTVTAKAAAGYALSGTASWSHDFTPAKPPVPAPVKVAAAAPAFDAKPGRYTIPAVTGVSYQANGKTVKAGTHAGGKAKVTVTAHPAAGYVLSGTVSWSHDFTPPKPPAQAPIKVTAAAPMFSRATGKYTIPTRAGVSYLVNGRTVKAGTYKGNKAKVTVTAKAAAGHVLSGKASWSYDFAPVKATAAKPTFNAKTGKYTIPSRTGVSYLVNGKAVKAGTYKGSYKLTTVTAKAKAGYALTGTASWKHDFRRVVKASAPSFSPAANRYTIPKKTGITYLVNGKPAKAGTHKVRNGQKITVTAKAASTYRLSGKARWSRTL
ncbi:CAP domain-containing protein [Arthrobacter sulfonylureivorans]|uniref:CAP domain-containing protein n=1 Tax=Arthrobacter sulfonylureivorans TaxID=2486855 RepID=A0ABY3WAJ8_9MICC|nr:CAP domain-containing protein [Arthrobacter sulfonylureivorans]UNK47368.1 CAP domain-containing protein [Arthrobacter sulfonylureivorans]